MIAGFQEKKNVKVEAAAVLRPEVWSYQSHFNPFYWSKQERDLPWGDEHTIGYTDDVL